MVRCAYSLRMFRLAAGLLLWLLVGSLHAHAQVVATWNGGSGNWSTATNWDVGIVPSNIYINGLTVTTYSVTITAPSSAVTMDLSLSIDNLTLGTGDSLDINAGSNLNLHSG